MLSKQVCKTCFLSYIVRRTGLLTYIYRYRQKDKPSDLHHLSFQNKPFAACRQLLYQATRTLYGRYWIRTSDPMRVRHVL